jgi:DNA-damage-inducible protein D
MPNNNFERIKQIDAKSEEYWSARELLKLLGYGEYNKFIPVVEKAIESCVNSGEKAKNHFARVSDMVDIGSGAERTISDIHLSRYACYLIAQNGDSRKEEIALAQTYFAIQTRKQEVHEQLMEDHKRVHLRGEMTTRNKKLGQIAKHTGVTNYANFQDSGYMGLYGGLRQKDIHKKKKLKRSEKILDHMGSEELAANIFRATQTDAKMRRENIFGKTKANKTHYRVGKKVRQTIKELGGTMPEKLPSAESIKLAQKRLKYPHRF